MQRVSNQTKVIQQGIKTLRGEVSPNMSRLKTFFWVPGWQPDAPAGCRSGGHRALWAEQARLWELEEHQEPLRRDQVPKNLPREAWGKGVAVDLKSQTDCWISCQKKVHYDIAMRRKTAVRPPWWRRLLFLGLIITAGGVAWKQQVFFIIQWPFLIHISLLMCAESKLVLQVLDVSDGGVLLGSCGSLAGQRLLIDWIPVASFKWDRLPFCLKILRLIFAVLHSRRQGTTGCSSVVTAFWKKNKHYVVKTLGH